MDTYDIFVSYRREGGEALACLIAERLKQQGYTVFYDIESLRSGKFNERIYQVIEDCKDVVVILPPHALDRCTDSEDWVRKEISFAIEKGKNVVPILMRGFEFPNTLPEDIAELKNYNGITANMEYFDASFKKLIGMLKSKLTTFYERLISSPACEDAISELNKAEEVSFAYSLGLCWEEYQENAMPSSAFSLAEKYEKLLSVMRYRESDGYAADPDLMKELEQERKRLYLFAAEADHPDAQVKIGDFYCAEGDFLNAQIWYSAAAKHEQAGAQYALGAFYAKHATELALYWLKKEASRPSEYASTKKAYAMMAKCCLRACWLTGDTWYFNKAQDYSLMSGKPLSTPKLSFRKIRKLMSWIEELGLNNWKEE